MLDFFKKLWKSVAKKLTAQILVFAILVIIIGSFLVIMSPQYQG